MGIEIGAAAYSRVSAAGSVQTKRAETAAEAKEEVTQEADSFTRTAETPVEETEGVIYKPNAALVEQLRADSETRMANLVQMMLGKQIDMASEEDLSFMWESLRTGNFEATEEEVLQAQKDTAEDGYWGVEQTSDRIVKFALGLTGGDPDKLDGMIEAFEKGYAEAEKTWGGELPELTQKTREAVLEKFKKLKEDPSGGLPDGAAQNLVEAAAQSAMTDAQS